jgi:hypothetical protein
VSFSLSAADVSKVPERQVSPPRSTGPGPKPRPSSLSESTSMAQDRPPQRSTRPHGCRTPVVLAVKSEIASNGQFSATGWRLERGCEISWICTIQTTSYLCVFNIKKSPLEHLNVLPFFCCSCSTRTTEQQKESVNNNKRTLRRVNNNKKTLGREPEQ